MSSRLKVTSGSGLVRSGMIASGCTLASRTTLVMRVATSVHTCRVAVLAGAGADVLRRLAGDGRQRAWRGLLARERSWRLRPPGERTEGDPEKRDRKAADVHGVPA